MTTETTKNREKRSPTYQRRYKLKVFYRDYAHNTSSQEFPCDTEEFLNDMIQIVRRHKFYVAHVRYYY
jgi:hypothetical protein